MFIKDSENGRMMMVNFTKQGIYISYAVKKPNGQVISYSITLAEVAEGYKPIDMAIFRHNPLKTQAYPCCFLGCDCESDGRTTSTPFELLREDEEKFWEYLEGE